MQGAYQAHPSPGGPPAAPRRRKRLLVIFLSVAGAFLLVIASLVVGLVLTSGGGQPDETAETDKQPPSAVEESEPASVVAQSAVQPEQAEGEPVAGVSDQGLGREPANLLGSLSLFNLAGTPGERQVIDSGEAEELDPAAVRQGLVDQLEALDITEADVADFLAAYDLLVSEDFTTAYAALTAEEQRAYELALLGAIEGYFESFLTDCDLSGAFNVGTEADVQADLVACVINSINQLGGDVVRISQEHGLAAASPAEE